MSSVDATLPVGVSLGALSVLWPCPQGFSLLCAALRPPPSQIRSRQRLVAELMLTSGKVLEGEVSDGQSVYKLSKQVPCRFKAPPTFPSPEHSASYAQLLRQSATYGFDSRVLYRLRLEEAPELTAHNWPSAAGTVHLRLSYQFPTRPPLELQVQVQKSAH